jgi:hypothetical protein
MKQRARQQVTVSEHRNWQITTIQSFAIRQSRNLLVDALLMLVSAAKRTDHA